VRFLLAVIFLFWLSGSGAAQASHEAVGKGAADGHVPARAALELTISIVEQKYCSDGGMMLDLRLGYKNIGESSLILFKYSLPAFQHRVSRSIEAAARKDYEQVLSPMMGSVRGDIQFGNEPPAEYFVVIKPGEVYTPVNVINEPIFIRAEDGDDGEDYLRPGQHVLQVNVSTWPFHGVSGADLTTRWQRFGTLWTEPMLSLPMAFRVAKPHDRLLSNCNAK
jgi:hypothetical protein